MKRSTQSSSGESSFQDSLDNGVLKEACNTQSCEGISIIKRINIYAHFCIETSYESCKLKICLFQFYVPPSLDSF